MMLENARQELLGHIATQIENLRGDSNEGAYLADILGLVSLKVHDMHIKQALTALQKEVARLSGSETPEPPRPTATVTYLQVVK